MTSYYNTNKNILRDTEEDRTSRIKTDRWIFILLLLAIGLVPILVGGYVKEVTSPHITNIELLSSGVKGDIFTHYKAIVLIIITLAAFGLLLSKIFFMDGKIRKTKLNIFLCIFFIAIVISTILSPSVSIALWGQYNRSDGAISYICYLTLFFVAMNIEYPKKALQYVMYSLYPFIFINLVLITMNFYGSDALTYPGVQKMMSLFLSEGSELSESSILLGTLNQWNFMSGMFAVMTVMYLAWSIIDKNMIRSFVNVFVAIISFSIMLMSISTSGFLTVVLMTPLLILLLVKSANLKKAILVLIAFVIVIIPVFHVLSEKNPRVWDESIGFVMKKNPYAKEQTAEIGQVEFPISIVKRAFAADNQFELPVLPERGVAIGSGRAYIWQKTLELAMERPLLGYGLDTLMYQFPHYNIDARAGMWTEDKIVDKPHSMYIGILYGSGIIGIIGFAGVALVSALAALKIVFRRKQALLTVIAVGWLAFLFQAIFNDSIPGTAGPMWALSGMMMGILLVNKEIEEKIDGRNN